MHTHLTVIVVVLISSCAVLAIDVMPELKKNVLNFECGENFKYEGMLTHSFDRFYVAAKYKIPKIGNLNQIKFNFLLEQFYEQEKMSTRQDLNLHPSQSG